MRNLPGDAGETPGVLVGRSGRFDQKEEPGRTTVEQLPVYAGCTGTCNLKETMFCTICATCNWDDYGCSLEL